MGASGADAGLVAGGGPNYCSSGLSSIMLASGSRHEWWTTTTNGRTLPLATKPRRPSPPNCISNRLRSYDMRAPLDRPLLTPRSRATKRPDSHLPWWEAEGHVSASGQLNA